ncbi:hypothetical protein ACFV9E_00225 [Streptomyces sp. NPDC059835]|uniref:hypothetical protein n=1 Tax=Streptomyces sp. NPDC059835 TaxID=3346967 RepID=UPI003665D628
MHKISLTSKVWYLLEGTGVMQGEESPEIKAEMDALKWNKRGVSGSVSLDTVGWLLDTLEAMGESEDKAENQAIRAALAKLDPIYRNNGGTVTTLGELRAEEEEAECASPDLSADQDQEHDQEQDQAPASSVDGEAMDCDLAEIQDVSSLGYGQPVYHEVRTGELVGYLTADRFTPIADIGTA